MVTGNSLAIDMDCAVLYYILDSNAVYMVRENPWHGTCTLSIILVQYSTV